MPYIKKIGRKQLQTRVQRPQNAGELNFLITDIVGEYLLEHGKSYQTFNDILGALEGAKLEMVRRQLNPYEDAKIKENGDIERYEK